MTLSVTRRAAMSRPGFALPSLSHVLGVWRQRQALSRLDDAALRDIGLTREDARAEVRRPLWDAPETWCR